MIGHTQAEHETSHGSMSRTLWTVEGPDGTSLEVNGRKFASNDTGAPMLVSNFCELGAICRNHECYSVQCSVRALAVTLTSIIACLKTQQHAVGKTSSTYPNVCFPTLMHPKIGLVTTYTGGERVRCDSRCELLGDMLISEYLNVSKVSKVGEHSVDSPLTYA